MVNPLSANQVYCRFSLYMCKKAIKFAGLAYVFTRIVSLHIQVIFNHLKL